MKYKIIFCILAKMHDKCRFQLHCEVTVELITSFPYTAVEIRSRRDFVHYFVFNNKMYSKVAFRVLEYLFILNSGIAGMSKCYVANKNCELREL